MKIEYIDNSTKIIEELSIFTPLLLIVFFVLIPGGFAVSMSLAHFGVVSVENELPSIWLILLIGGVAVFFSVISYFSYSEDIYEFDNENQIFHSQSKHLHGVSTQDIPYGQIKELLVEPEGDFDRAGPHYSLSVLTNEGEEECVIQSLPYEDKEEIEYFDNLVKSINLPVNWANKEPMADVGI